MVVERGPREETKKNYFGLRILSEKCGLEQTGLAGGFEGESEVFVGEFRSDATTGSALEKADLKEKRFVDVLNRVNFFAEDGSDRVDSDRTTVELFDDRAQETAIGLVKAVFVHVEQT